jgi:endonuclease/exonuclease/phosphatase family metal-dependent hydrolase
MQLRSAWLLLALLWLFMLGAACNSDDNGDSPDPTGDGATQEPTADDGEAQALTVVSYNILHGLIDEDPEAEPFDRFPERIQLIAAALGELKPDVIMLQEVAPDKEPDYGDAEQILLDALGPDYQVVFGNIAGDPIGTGGGLGQMTLTRLPVVSSENRVVNAGRVVQRITVTTDLGDVDLYNAHVTGLDEEQDALVEIGNVLSFIRETRSGAGPVIVGGDFNAVPDDPSIAAMLDEGFVDVLASGGDATCAAAGDPGCTNGTIPLSQPGNRADRRIDYMFMLNGSEVLISVSEASLFMNEPVDIGDGQVLWGSDHIGNQAVLELQ